VVESHDRCHHITSYVAGSSAGPFEIHGRSGVKAQQELQSQQAAKDAAHQEQSLKRKELADRKKQLQSEIDAAEKLMSVGNKLLADAIHKKDTSAMSVAQVLLVSAQEKMTKVKLNSRQYCLRDKTFSSLGPKNLAIKQLQNNQDLIVYIFLKTLTLSTWAQPVPLTPPCWTRR